MTGSAKPQMRKSRAVPLVAVPLLAAAFTGCGDPEQAYCVDRSDNVVENQYCGDDHHGGSAGYFWYFGGNAGSTPIGRGSHLSGGDRIVSTDKSSLQSRSGGFGSSARSGGVGSVTKGGGGFGGGSFSGGG